MNNGSPSARQSAAVEARRSAIARLNDALRGEGYGGRVVMTAGLAALPAVTQAAILLAGAAFEAFDVDNDPHGEHDFGLVEVAGQHIAFKIDAFDLGLSMHSPDPADPTVTCRVLTIMLAEEM